jgi:hypothetical protein
MVYHQAAVPVTKLAAAALRQTSLMLEPMHWTNDMKRPVVRTGIASVLALALLAGCNDDSSTGVIGERPQPPTSESALVDALESAYQTRSLAGFEPLFHADFWYSESTLENPVAICREQWICLHRRLFNPGSIPPGETPVELWLTGISIAVTPRTAFDERHEYYQSEVNPEGLNSMRWRVTAADLDVQILFETQGETDFQVSRRARFVVADDRSKAVGEDGKYSFYRIDVSAQTGPGVQTESTTWAGVLSLYGRICPSCPPPAAVGRVLESLESAYATRVASSSGTRRRARSPRRLQARLPVRGRRPWRRSRGVSYDVCTTAREERHD